ncbi:MAG TPA: YqgE/AlgH family protein, partial [Prolixibacteraceae bacterium]|nr:YqgE/AlgH family protein [Prolixibacteraceae bacterium]
RDIFRIKTNDVAPKKGRVLIAEPFLPGSYFNRSIIFLVNHSSDGSVGFILNKPVDFPIPEFYKEFPDYTDPIFVGGPVDIESLYFIHRYGQLIDDSVHIMGDLYWGGNFNQLKDLINKGKIDPNHVRFFLGYSGWDKGQLKEEIDEDSWLVADIPPAFVMGDTTELWKEMVKKIGGIYSLWENYPENPTLN